MLNKTLFAVFIFLLVVFFLEVGYLTVYQKNTLNPEKVTSTQTVITPQMPQTLQTQAIRQSTLEGLVIGLGVLKKGVLKNALLDYEVQGKIINITYSEEDNNNSTPSSHIELEGDAGDVNTFFFSQKDLQLLKIVEKNQNEEKILNFSQLKQGDNVKIHIVADMLKIDFTTTDNADSFENIDIEKYD